MDTENPTAGGVLAVEPGSNGSTRVRLSGALNQSSVAQLWVRTAEIRVSEGGEVVVDAEGVTHLDSAGIALLMHLRQRAKASGARWELRGLPEHYRGWVERFRPGTIAPAPGAPPACSSLPAQVGATTAAMWGDLWRQVAFIGELAQALGRAMLRPRLVRWRDLWVAAERAGVDAFPIVALISGLVGLVLAFQSAMAMRPYGAEIYVANLVTIAMLRELGPLMTAIILSGRSGGAFAAEIGTMKVNDEVAALRTMGLEPVPFLAVPRIAGLVLMVPFLTLFADVVGILGGSLIFLSLDYPMSAYFDQALGAAEVRHLLGGLVKSVAFGLTIAGVGCLRGLETARGPSAVGASTTRAVVTSILFIVILDAIFGTLFYFLGF